MKSSSKVIGLPLMSVKEGQKVGSVQDIVVDAQKKKVDALVVRGSKNEYDFQQLKISDVIGIGKDYVILQSIENVKSVASESVGVPLLNIQCIASSGDVLGTVIEFEFDEKAGTINTLKIDTGNAVKGENILTISNNLLFVQNSNESPVSSVNPMDSEDTAPVVNNANNTLEKEQRDYMIGRVVKNDVKDQNGNIIVSKGTMVNSAIIEKAENAGLTIDLMLELE